MILVMNRSSRPEVFCKKGDPKNFAKFTGKHLCKNLVFNKLAGLRSFGETVSITRFKLAFSFDHWFHRNEIKKNSI